MCVYCNTIKWSFIEATTAEFKRDTGRVGVVMGVGWLYGMEKHTHYSVVIRRRSAKQPRPTKLTPCGLECILDTRVAISARYP